MPLGEIPADPTWLRKRLSNVAPARLNISKKTWTNILSNGLAALSLCGATSTRVRTKQLDTKWQELWDRLDDFRARTALSRFVDFCSRLGVPPEDVTDVVVEQFVQAIAFTSLRKDPKLIHYGLAKAWNAAPKIVRAWPDTKLTVPSRQTRFTRRYEELPDSFRNDLELYLQARRDVDLLAHDAQRPLARVTLDHHRRQIRRFFGELTLSGLPDTSIPDLRALVQPDNVRRGLQQMISRNGGRASGMALCMATTLKSIALNYVRSPDHDLAGLDQMCRRLKSDHRGMTVKNRQRLRQFDDPGHLQGILNLPQRLFREAASGKIMPYRSALLAEVGLAIELLLMTALRIKNLSRLHLDVNFQWSRASRSGVCHLVVEPKEVKNGQHLEFELEQETVELLRSFLADYRPTLCSPACRWLFGRKDGQDVPDPTALSTRITKVIWEKLGVDVNPHLFRSLVSKLYLDQNPGAYEAVRRLLGHTNTSTTIAAYTGLESVTAAKHFDQTIRRLRDDQPIPRSSRRRISK